MSITSNVMFSDIYGNQHILQVPWNMFFHQPCSTLQCHHKAPIQRTACYMRFLIVLGILLVSWANLLPLHLLIVIDFILIYQLRQIVGK